MRRVMLVPRVGAGVGFFTSRDTVTADAVTAIDRALVVVDRSGAGVRNNPIFFLPSLDAEIDLSVVKASVGLVIPVLLNNGPSLPLGEGAPSESSAGCQPAEARCSKGTTLFASPVAYRASAFFALSVGVFRRF